MSRPINGLDVLMQQPHFSKMGFMYGGIALVGKRMVPLGPSEIRGRRKSFKVLMCDSAVRFPSRIVNYDFLLAKLASQDHHRATTEGSTIYVELVFSKVMPVIHKP